MGIILLSEHGRDQCIVLRGTLQEFSLLPSPYYLGRALPCGLRYFHGLSIWLGGLRSNLDATSFVHVGKNGREKVVGTSSYSIFGLRAFLIELFKSLASSRGSSCPIGLRCHFLARRCNTACTRVVSDSAITLLRNHE